MSSSVMFSTSAPNVTAARIVNSVGSFASNFAKPICKRIREVGFKVRREIARIHRLPLESDWK